jgi:hypothetical protein
MMLFETNDFEAREDHTYSVEVTARIEKGGDEAEVATKFQAQKHQPW